MPSITNGLFLVCPFSQMENFITNHFGEVFIFTAPASIFSLEDKEAVDEMKIILRNERITDIYLAIDTGCRFIRNAIAGNNLPDFTCEEIIAELKNANDDAFSLSRKIVLHQLKELNSAKLIAEEIKAFNISLHGIVTSKKENKAMKVS